MSWQSWYRVYRHDRQINFLSNQKEFRVLKMSFTDSSAFHKDHLYKTFKTSHLWMRIKSSSQHFFCKVAIFYFIPDQALDRFLSICSRVKNEQYKQVHNFVLCRSIHRLNCLNRKPSNCECFKNINHDWYDVNLRVPVSRNSNHISCSYWLLFA